MKKQYHGEFKIKTLKGIGPSSGSLSKVTEKSGIRESTLKPIYQDKKASRKVQPHCYSTFNILLTLYYNIY
jgi:hypothetical protein